MKILIYADMLCNTGFAHVSHNIIKQLRKDGHTFIGVGINYRGEPAQIYYPELADIPVFPTSMNDMFGKQRILDVMKHAEYDTLFVIGDVFNLAFLQEPLKEIRARGKKSVLYFPVDCSIKEDWVDTIKSFDKAVTYTEFAHNECVKFGLDIPYIYHGYDEKIYYARNQEECRKELFPFLTGDYKLISNVSVNQPRKDFPRTIDVFNLYHKINENSYLYLHCIPNDQRGYNLIDYIRTNYPHLEKNIIFPDTDDMKAQRFNDEFIAKIYCASDLNISTSLGEGWGLSATESLACGTPIVVPNHTSYTEIVEQFGGKTAKIEGYKTIQFDNAWRRPVVNISDMVGKMCTNIKIHSTIEDITWDKIGLQWRELINKL